MLLILIAVFIFEGYRNVLSVSKLLAESDDIHASLLESYNKHLLWSKNLSQGIYDNEEYKVEVILDHNLCDFGKWYYGDGRHQAEQLIPQLKVVFESMEKPHEALHHTAVEIKKEVESGSSGLDAAKKIYQTQTLEQIKVLGNLFNQAIKVTNDVAEDAHLKLNSEVERIKIVTFLILIAAVLLSLLISFIISKGILKNVNKGMAFAQEVAKGNLMADVDIKTKDEIGLLLGSFKETVVKIKEVVKQVHIGANNLLNASEEMSNTSQEISQWANEQAASVEEVSSSMEQMGANIQQNSLNAQQTEKIAIYAEEGMQKVKNTSNESLESVKEIANKITIISDIAFQTNILALNAAVEAARAGEHGRGFAVVAAEVRKLAERSKIAADEINSLSTKTVTTTEHASSLINEILPEINRTATPIKEIATASSEQNVGADQIGNAIQQLNQVTQQNASASEEVATSAEELSSQANLLSETIGFFKITNNAEHLMQTASKIKKTGLNLSKENLKMKHERSLKSAKSQSKGVNLNLNGVHADEQYERY